MQRPPRILFAAGGTGGHVYPALAIADAVREIEPEAVISFAGTEDRMEWEVVPKAGYPIYPITVSGFQRSLSLRNLSFPFKLMKGVKQSWDLVNDFDADVIVGTGGYVSGPVLFSANLRGRPIILQEQNAYAGVTNKLLGRSAARIHIAFPEAAKYFPVGRSTMSGNPTRPELRTATREQGRAHFEVPDKALLLFMFGGSLGSAALNAAMEVQLPRLLEDERVYVIWQTGNLYYERYAARVKQHPRLRLRKYIERMDLAYAATDVTLCRAGAITCSELMVTGSPAVLVPSPNVAEDHQTKNARSMANVGAAVLLPEEKLEEEMVGAVQGLFGDVVRCKHMATAAHKLARPGAARKIAKDVLSLSGWIES